MGNDSDREEDKARQQKRIARQVRHWSSRDEELRRKAEAKARRATQRPDRPRTKSWQEPDDDGADAPAFEKMTPSVRGRSGPRTGAPAPAVDRSRAVVIAVHHGRVDLDTGKSARVAARLLLDPDFTLAVGDEVEFVATDGPPRIEARVPRRTFLARPDPGNAQRDLVLAANVDVAVITVAAADPPLRPGLIDRFLLALARGSVTPAVCVNKLDLVTDVRSLDAVLTPYVELRVPLFRCSVAQMCGLEPLRAHLAGKTCVFVGHSGVGKSSLLNALDPGGTRSVGAVRPHDGKGKHTTSWSSLRQLGDGTRVIDTPGIRALGLTRLDRDELHAAFPEIAAAARGCRFADCSHQCEPRCAVRSAVAAGQISAARFASYARLLADDGAE